MARPECGTSEFLLRELLAALGAAPPADAAADSFGESLSEDSESQQPPRAAGRSRVMLVRRTNSSRQTATLVDRSHGVEAYVPRRVAAALQQQSGFQTLGRLRGSVVRVTEYHFATLRRCLAADARSRDASVSAPDVGDVDRVYLCVDALAVVDENELAVHSLPAVTSHPLVADLLRGMDDAELEKQLMINQGLPPISTESDRFDDERPLLEEDCVIPEDQEQELELEEQDGWGPTTAKERQPTDSELIEENGPVPMTESEVVLDPVSQDRSKSTQDSLSLSGNPPVGWSDEASVRSSMESQKYAFQQENIRETFVAGSDLESDTEDEDQETKTPNTSKSQVKARHKNRERPADRSSPAPATPKGSQSSCMVVDLTGDTPKKASPSPTQRKEQDKELVPKAEDNGLHEAGDNTSAAEAHELQHSPPPTQGSPETETPAKGWGVLPRIRQFFLGTPTEDHHEHSDAEEGEFAENEEGATQVLDQSQEEEKHESRRHEGKDDKHAEPEEFLSSQATVMLHYAVDNEEDANAFEYEGILSDDMTSPRSVAHKHDNSPGNKFHSPAAEETDTTDDMTLTERGVEEDLTLTEEVPEVAVTPQRRPVEKDDDNAAFKTPSPSAQAVTPGTEKRADAARRARSVVRSEEVARDDSRPASPPVSKDPVFSTDPSAQLSPNKTPSKLVISVGRAGDRSTQGRRTGFSTAGAKRRHQESPTQTPAVQQHTESVPQLQEQPDEQPPQLQKRRRGEPLSVLTPFEGGSQSPQFEQPVTPFLSRRRLQSDHGNIVADSYSLDAVSRSLGTSVRDQVNNEANQAQSTRQPRRAWKRYENLFPPLNMTRLKQIMTESKNKRQPRSDI
ncbi:unnamed protein product [Phytophthora lilii]|uniref:Unnamed protein product n=1 Tax=Phytophthora lilii TaxID=2077276 RepID=A0A9W6WRA2_9STRA|nr:unnamed protein product [Phytophthora lilii]